MRVAVIVLVAFVCLYVAVAGVGAFHHGSEPPSDASSRPSLPNYIAAAWPIVPPFLKVGAADIGVVGASFDESTATLVVPSLANATLEVAPATAWYQPQRLLRLRYRKPETGIVALSYPPLVPVSSSGTPEPLAPGKSSQTIVLPKTGGSVTLTCSAPLPCSISL